MARLNGAFTVRRNSVKSSDRQDVSVVADKKDQKTKAKAEQVKGKAKEVAGRAVGDEPMETEGRLEQSKGDARQAKEKIKDTFKH